MVAKLDATDPNHVVIEMGRGFRALTAAEKQSQYAAVVPAKAPVPQAVMDNKYFEQREEGKQVLARLADKDAIDYAEAEFLGDPELSPIFTSADALAT